jgi:TonB family protein
MFNNLIESSSHRREFKRRGSFFLFTTATYALLFVIAGVVSIYAYDARLEDQNTEVVTLLTPVDFSAHQAQSVNHSASAPRNNNPRQTFDERRIAIAPVDRPIQPTNISTTPNPILPLRDGITTLITNRDVNAAAPGGLVGPTNGGISQARSPGAIVIEVGTPPPALVPKPAPKLISKGVITSEAISLPKPPYPGIALQVRAQGTVAVQVVIDETGRVISAHLMSGHPLLAAAAVKAAYQARFSPTMLGDHPVKVSGVITYNFVLQ